MFLGACLDLGMPLQVLHETVERLGLPGVAVEARKARRGGITGTRFRVLEHGRPIEGPDPDEVSTGTPAEHDHRHHPHAEHHEHHEHHEHAGHHEQHGHAGESAGLQHVHSHGPGAPGRGFAEIGELIAKSALSVPVKERALQLFARLGEAEAKVHGVPLAQVHFHEVGAVDAIVDLTGAASAVEFLGSPRISSSPANVGGGTVLTAHGRLPVPAPATVELLRGLPIYGSALGEVLTPTGAVLLAELVDEFGEMPSMTIEAAGYGLGKRDIAGQPNAVRALWGNASESASPQVEVLECEVDDLAGEGFGFLMEKLLGAGALDVYFTAIQMKKNRPGVLVSVLCRREQLESLVTVLLTESGSLGCRTYSARRYEAAREIVQVPTPFGVVAIKRARFGDRVVAEAPEYEDCRRLALAASVPWREVYAAALAAVATDPGSRR
jgi:pyridinium-3,5-bisthiocarboxylic acid mononucleotide nickel chelatase